MLTASAPRGIQRIRSPGCAEATLRPIEYPSAEEGKVAEDLVLCRGGHVLIYSQARDESGDFHLPHLILMSLVEIESETLGPACVGSLRVVAVVPGWMASRARSGDRLGRLAMGVCRKPEV